jgi:hypothetical protein
MGDSSIKSVMLKLSDLIELSPMFAVRDTRFYLVKSKCFVAFLISNSL